jgi:hypothetical protein
MIYSAQAPQDGGPLLSPQAVPAKAAIYLDKDFNSIARVEHCFHIGNALHGNNCAEPSSSRQIVGCGGREHQDRELCAGTADRNHLIWATGAEPINAGVLRGFRDCRGTKAEAIALAYKEDANVWPN